MGFLAEHCVMAPLTSSLRARLTGIACKHEPDIEHFFAEESVLNDSQMLSTTYCMYLQETSEAVCAFCVSSSDVSVDLIPKRARNKINRRIPYVKQRDHYPAVLVGQLAVFDKFASLHLGDELMELIKLWIVTVANHIAARYIIVDAVNDSHVISYYERNGFSLVFTTEEVERQANEIDESENLKTRFMLSDLMPIRQKLTI